MILLAATASIAAAKTCDGSAHVIWRSSFASPLITLKLDALGSPTQILQGLPGLDHGNVWACECVYEDCKDRIVGSTLGEYDEFLTPDAGCHWYNTTTCKCNQIGDMSCCGPV